MMRSANKNYYSEHTELQLSFLYVLDLLLSGLQCVQS